MNKSYKMSKDRVLVITLLIATIRCCISSSKVDTFEDAGINSVGQSSFHDIGENSNENKDNEIDDSNDIPKEETKPQRQRRIDEAPCQIFHSPFGCCWDNRTIARGPNGEGCKVCKDVNKKWCNWYNALQLCGSPRINVKCPVTCGVPCARKCKDDDGLEKMCQFLKKGGSCKYVKRECRKTCGIC
eukprot:Seg516.2 transcript_id=Seg516.2/GoldUCD/mRNA.D3Y31 product="hypothetical protein" protein_id=Seg516.2/GoldUCD/D3Y31